MNLLADIQAPIADELKEYNELFDKTLSHEDEFIGSALKYIKSRKGKMMRPILVLLMAKAFGKVSKRAYYSAVTLELLHTASLIHDDVVDDSDKRRGQASVKAVYDNKVAVLLGDYLLSKALHLSALTDSAKIVDIIARLGGTLSEGEIYQLQAIRAENCDEAEYFKVIHHKTAALFAACAQLGAISAGANEEEVRKADLFGAIVGNCFQIRDDIFDYYNDERIGKPTGNDMLEGKITLPALYVVNAYPSPKVMHWKKSVKEGTATKEEIHDFVEFTKEKGGIQYAESRMSEFHDQASKALNALPVSSARDALKLYLDYTVGRQM